MDRSYSLPFPCLFARGALFVRVHPSHALAGCCQILPVQCTPCATFPWPLRHSGVWLMTSMHLPGERPHSPSGWMTVNAGLGFGATADWFWGGLSMGAFFSISNHGGHFSITVSASACGWAPMIHRTPACPVGACFGFCPQGCIASPSIAGCFKCMRATGVSISLMCCDVNLIDGSNSCR